MKRKIVQHGASSLTVTLPSTWVKKFGINKGDEVDVEEEGTKITVGTVSEIKSPKKMVDTSKFGIFTKNNLTHLYQLGYDDIEIRFSEDNTPKEMQERVQECIGFEIIDQKSNKIEIKSIAHTLESEFDIMLRKSFLITKDMSEEVLNAITKKDYSKLFELRNLEFLNNKFTMACVRILHKRGYQNPDRIMQIYDIIKGLERIADEYKYICDLLKEHNQEISKDVLDYFQKINDFYSSFYKIFYKFDSELKKYIYLNRNELRKKGRELLMKSKGKESILLSYLMRVIEKTYDAAGEYFALIL
ncbi:AbrB/MazE/SpoVT family DNA-binding domain-containing protein [Nanoarchaeota archaeon]